MTFPKFIPFTPLEVASRYASGLLLTGFSIIISLIFNNFSYALVERPAPIVPAPKDTNWGKIKSYPYTMVIKTNKYGEFNFTREADRALDGYKKLCRDTKYSMEIPAVALVNKKKEIADLIYPSDGKILLLNIDIDKIYEYNMENISLVKELEKAALNPDQRDSIIQKIIANSIYHPLGEFYLVKKNNKLMIFAGIANQKVYLPAECINNPLRNLIQRNCLVRYFQKEEINKLTDKKIIEFINKRSRHVPLDNYTILEDFPIRKDWYVITTPNTCFWTDYFVNYIEIESKKMDIESKIPIHLHPLTQMQWLLNTKKKFWIEDYEIHLLPSNKDIEFFKSRYPDSNIYIIVGKDLYSDELTWAVYPDISFVEKEMEKIEQNKWNYEQLKTVLKDIKNTRGSVQRYYAKKTESVPGGLTGTVKGLIVDSEIDTLLMLNKRQIMLLSEIDKYRKEYPWRMLNTSFFIPLLNEQLAEKGWKIASSKKEVLGYNADKREFYYKEWVTARMDLFLFILFKLCYLEENDLKKGLEREALTIGFLKEICNQLDYLCIKYYHLKKFSEHLEYLSNIIRLTIWNREKDSLIAKEQINNGRYYLDRYNLGYFKDASQDRLTLISGLSFSQGAEIIDIEDIVRKLSKKQKVKNIEEFIMEFEKQLVLVIFDRIS